MSERVNKATMEAIKLGGEEKVFRVESVADFHSQQRMAYYVRQNCPREDGGVYIISTSGVDMAITIKVEKQQ